MTTADLERQPTVEPQPVFFPVSLQKLAVLSIFSFGIYQVYWFYQNWKREQAREAKPFGLSPGILAFFAPLSAYSLFNRVNRQLGLVGDGPVQAGMLALTFFIWTVLWRLPDPYWLASIFSFVPLLPVQAAVNRLHETVAPTAPRNDRYSGGNTLTIIFGALLLCLIVLGMLLPPENAAGVAPGVAS